ncbi:unnamed protein product [Urochloa humidicola]
MALEQLKGKWDDSFEHAFSFKVKVEMPTRAVTCASTLSPVTRSLCQED